MEVRYLTQSELLELPDLTKVTVTWSGGNGPYDYHLLNRDGVSYALTEREVRTGLYRLGWERTLSFLGSESPYTTVCVKD